MAKFVVKKESAGNYSMTCSDYPDQSVTIFQANFWDGPGWIAAAKWISDVYTDPLATKREAVEVAEGMFIQWGKKSSE